ncbi:MAG: coproporphyrinogen III oxidase, partial [Bacteroidota bacterium]
VVLDMAAEKRMIHYEVSNFALEGYISRHNSAYWTGKKYLGIGPSAHSFDGCKRSWNVAVNADYIQALKKYELPSEFEILSKVNQLNDYLLTSLRTIWGIDILKISNEFGDKRATGILEKAQAFIEGKDLIFHDNHLIPTEKGLFRSDMIISALMVND